MSGSFRGPHGLPPAEIAEIVREARRMRVEAFAALYAAAVRGIRTGLCNWVRHQPTAPFAGSLSGRAR
jgi:hypothetical protein